MTTFVFDAGALIALEKRDPRVVTLVRKLSRRRIAAHLPAGVLAQVWRGHPKQHPLAALLKTNVIRVHPLAEEAAYRIGRALASRKKPDVVDAHVALLALSLGATVLTSDPDDIASFDSRIRIVRI